MKRYEFEAAVRAGAPDLLDRLFADIKEDCRVFTELFAKPGSMVLVQHLGSTISIDFSYDMATTDAVGRPTTVILTKTLTVEFDSVKLEIISTGTAHNNKALTVRDQRIAFLDESTVCEASEFFLAAFLFSDKGLLR